jgi:putative phosphoesterase
MVRIAVISDTHGYIGEDVEKHLSMCDEIWHAGDIGSINVEQYLKEGQILRAVYGNIDGLDRRLEYPENQVFKVGDLKVLMTHIGGYPPRYTKRVKSLLDEVKPDIYICGHSHILKIIPDKKRGLIHINPGACGFIGFHKFRTIVLFDIVNGALKNVRVVELGRRGQVDINA